MAAASTRLAAADWLPLDAIHRFLGHDIPGAAPVVIREAPSRKAGGYASAHDTPGIVQLDENAGVIDLGDGWLAAFRIESHNHPSFVEPSQGAATGVGGILRDVFTMGARPIAVMDPLRFGPLDAADVAARLAKVHGHPMAKGAVWTAAIWRALEATTRSSSIA